MEGPPTRRHLRDGNHGNILLEFCRTSELRLFPVADHLDRVHTQHKLHPGPAAVQRASHDRQIHPLPVNQGKRIRLLLVLGRCHVRAHPQIEVN